MSESLVRTGLAARRLNLSPERLRQLVKAGALPATETDLGLQFSIEDLDRFAAARRRRVTRGQANHD